MKTVKFSKRNTAVVSGMIFVMLLSMTMFTSCMATVRTPRHVGSSITIQSGDRSPRQQRMDQRNERRNHRERDRDHN